MAQVSHDEATISARIVYWGIEGSGKTANLRAVYRRLRPDHRGEIEQIPTRIDPTIEYEILPIELGEIAGLRTRIQMIAVPGRPDQAPTRKQLLDQVDGIVLVIDSQRERIQDNAASLEELRGALRAYGLTLDTIPLVIQYNKRDLSDPYALEELHRKLDVHEAAVFEAVASESTGVLQTLSTVSKQVIRALREKQVATGSGISEANEEYTKPATSSQPSPEAEFAKTDDAPLEVGPETPPSSLMEDAILATDQHVEADAIEAAAQQSETLLDNTWKELAEECDPVESAQLGSEFTICSVGEAVRRGARGIQLPIEIADKQGRTSKLMLSIELDPILDGDSD